MVAFGRTRRCRPKKSPQLRATLSEENTEQRFEFSTWRGSHSPFCRAERQAGHEMLLHREEHRH
jgi:hypothetical protein